MCTLEPNMCFVIEDLSHLLSSVVLSLECFVFFLLLLLLIISS